MRNSTSRFFASAFLLTAFPLVGCSVGDLLSKKEAPVSEPAAVKEEPKKEEKVEDTADSATTEAPETPIEPPEEVTTYETLTPKSDEMVSYLSATAIDKADIEKCLFNLSGHPFNLSSGTFSFRRIEFDKLTGTIAHALTDTAASAEPQIVLIRALETIGSSLIFTLENPKAYYCFKNVDDVGTDYQLSLHCSARISETLEWTDIKYKKSVPTAVEQSGVYLSAAKAQFLTHTKPQGAACLPGR
jgi:hypothetical protein